MDSAKKYVAVLVPDRRVEASGTPKAVEKPMSIQARTAVDAKKASPSSHIEFFRWPSRP